MELRGFTRAGRSKFTDPTLTSTKSKRDPIIFVGGRFNLVNLANILRETFGLILQGNICKQLHLRISQCVDGSTCRDSQTSHRPCPVLPTGLQLLVKTAVMKRWGRGREERGEREREGVSGRTRVVSLVPVCVATSYCQCMYGFGTTLIF